MGKCITGIITVISCFQSGTRCVRWMQAANPVTAVLQPCYRAASNLLTSLLQPCSTLLQPCDSPVFNPVTSVLQPCFNPVTALLQPCHTRASRSLALSQGCSLALIFICFILFFIALCFPQGKDAISQKPACLRAALWPMALKRKQSPSQSSSWFILFRFVTSLFSMGKGGDWEETVLVSVQLLGQSR